MAGDARSPIEEAMATFVVAFNSGDTATLASLYAEEAAILPPGGERVDGRANIQAFWQGAIDSGLKVDHFNIDEIFANGDKAANVGGFVLTAPGDGGITEIAGKYIVIWKRTDHTWQLYRDIWNTN